MAEVLLSTSSVFPHTELGFRLAREHGYGGVEVMVNHDRRSQSIDALRSLSETYGVAVRSVHVPCLVITQHVWGWNPEVKLRRSVEMAAAVGAEVVVVHPPFRWQREYAASFAALVDELHLAEGGPSVTVENMYSVDAFGRDVEPYLGATDDDFARYPAITLDTSHAAADRRDIVELYERWGPMVEHLHLSDSTTTRGDEHLPIGMGTLPLSRLATAMRAGGFAGHVVLEIGIGRLPEAARAAAAGASREWASDEFGV